MTIVLLATVRKCNSCFKKIFLKKKKNLEKRNIQPQNFYTNTPLNRLESSDYVK